MYVRPAASGRSGTRGPVRPSVRPSVRMYVRVYCRGHTTSTPVCSIRARTRTYVRTYVPLVRTIKLCNFLIGQGHTCALRMRTMCVLGGIQRSLPRYVRTRVPKVEHGMPHCKHGIVYAWYSLGVQSNVRLPLARRRTVSINKQYKINNSRNGILPRLVFKFF